MKSIAIIGAGASGLFLARKLAEVPGISVSVFERCKNVGTKLRASGGGKANIFNTNVLPEYYNNPSFVQELLARFTPQQLQREFEQLGLMVTTDGEGRVYPCTEFSQTVVDVLQQPLAGNVKWIMDCEVTALIPVKGQWKINNHATLFDVVVLASGSPANMIPKNRVEYNGFLTNFDLKINTLHPSLVGFRIAGYPKSIAGCRLKVKASLFQHNNLIHEECGEVTFKDDGLSGIVVMNLSAYYNRLADPKKCHLVLDLLPQRPDYDVLQHVRRFHSLQGLLHPKLVALYENKPFDLHHFRLDILNTYDLTSAQVCHGGIDVSEMNADFSFKRFPGLYATGEILDVDGLCGGYNLFFAFASAWVVSKSITSM